jgi:methylitaconate Delta-isomerase
MGVPHKAYAGTVAISTGVAAVLRDTVVSDVFANGDVSGPRRLRIGHPSGVIGVEVEVTDEGAGPVVRRAAIERTARRIMDGVVYVPSSRVFASL